MSDVQAVQVVDVCANCGEESSDDIKLKNCAACRLVKYCSADCQMTHRKQHKEVCKKRAAELKDERLYGLGHERPEGDFCPICTMAIPLPMNEHSGDRVCCMKRVCNGCQMAAIKRGIVDCPYCRTPYHEEDNAKALAQVQKRVDAKDSEAVDFLASNYYCGTYGLEKDVPRAIELWTEAAELGCNDARYKLSCMFSHGNGVPQDKTKAARYLELAAMQGHVESRHNLGYHETEKGNYERAVRHFLISTKMGEKESLDTIKDMFVKGVATKQQYAEALKGYQIAIEEMKSPERDEAKPFFERQHSA